MMSKKWIAVLFVIIIAVFCGAISGIGNGEPCERKNFVALVDNNDYSKAWNGTYTCWGDKFKYKIEVSDPENKSRLVYVILTNDRSIPFERVDYRLKEASDHPVANNNLDFVILGWYK